MRSILSCIVDAHDGRLLLLAAVVCTLGVYGASSIAAHAGRLQGRARLLWGATGICAAGCTAWATHMIGLLAFNPGMHAGFDSVLTALSLLAAVAGIGAGVGLALGQRDRPRRFGAGVVLGASVTFLHYIGQLAYVVTGTTTWDLALVAWSVAASLLMFGASVVVIGERNRSVRRLGAPLLLASIAVLHFCGMTATSFSYDPTLPLPPGTWSPDLVVPVVAGVSLGLLVLAVLGLRFTLAAKLAARRDRERLRELASLAVEGLAICVGDEIVTANQSLEVLVGVGPAALAGRRLASLLPALALSDLPEREERDSELVGADGQFVPVRVLRREVVMGGRRQSVVAVRDQRERLRTEAKIRALAFSDALTGLPNRVRFGELLDMHAAASRSLGAGFAVSLIDLDRFKLVNDNFGHGAGDIVLREVANRIRAAASEQDIVARLGGDEFAVLQPRAGTPDASDQLARTIVASMAEPFVVNGQRVHIGASVGTATAPDDGLDGDTLLSNADLALYKAKADGKGAHRRFEPAMEQVARARRDIEIDLRAAIEATALDVYFQPLLDTKSRKVTGAEALVRWTHPARGPVPPSEFIPIAEEAGLIGPLGRWVLRTACFEAASWANNIRVAVNLSPVQFRDADLVQVVKDALSDAKLPAARLELEITEGVLIQDEDRILATLRRLRDLGVSLSLDDFGTGYSSLSYLRRFPFNKVKIDQSFVRNLPDDPESAAIIRAIVALSGCLGMSTTIEGVETRGQYASAVKEGCDQVQGYLVSRPMPAAQFSSYLAGDRAEAA